MKEDLHSFLKDFGEKIVFTLEDGTIIDKDSCGEELLGIFDKSYANPEMGYMIVKTTKPRLTCVEADVAEVKKGAKVLIKNETYSVLSNDDDGTGFTILELSNK